MPAPNVPAGKWGEGAQSQFASQSIPDLYQGTAPILDFYGVARSGSPASWNVRLTIIPDSGTTLTVDSAISISVSGSSPWVATISCPLLHDDTLLLGTGDAVFQLDRTDSGAEDILASGILTIREPDVALP